MLRGTPGWDRDSIRAAMWVGEAQTVRLREPIPTHIVYWTAWVDDDGRVRFRDDIYSLDGVTGGDVPVAPRRAAIASTPSAADVIPQTSDRE